MEGLTIKEMAKALKISANTVNMRIFRAGIKPLTKDAIYPFDTLERIRNVPGKGRPKKSPPPSDK